MTCLPIARSPLSTYEGNLSTPEYGNDQEKLDVRRPEITFASMLKLVPMAVVCKQHGHAKGSPNNLSIRGIDEPEVQGV